MLGKSSNRDRVLHSVLLQRQRLVEVSGKRIREAQGRGGEVEPDRNAPALDDSETTFERRDRRFEFSLLEVNKAQTEMRADEVEGMPDALGDLESLVGDGHRLGAYSGDRDRSVRAI